MDRLPARQIQVLDFTSEHGLDREVGRDTLENGKGHGYHGDL